MSFNMHSNMRSKLISFNLKTLSAAVVSALLFSNAYAAGLGKLTVLSSLGQPLNAEIELTSVSKNEAGALVAKLASPEAFRQASIELNPSLMSLRFTLDQRGERKFIRVTSPQPINEPFVDMLLELGGPNGRLVREYTFLLDPVETRPNRPAQIASVPASTQPAPQPAAQAQAQAAAAAAAQTDAPAATEEKAVAKPAPAAKSPAAKPAKSFTAAASADTKEEQDGADYTVKKGDTLAKIAGQLKQGGVSLDQMLVGLYRANPNAFAGKNMNRLKSGQILTVPDAEAARSISTAEAQKIVVAQSADFANYRNKLATQVAASAPEKAADNKQSSSGKITAKVEEQATPANESKDKLKLSKTLPPQNAAPEKAAAAKPNPAAVAPSEEERIAKQKAAAEADARVKDLEKNVNDLQKILEVKNKSLAAQQNQAMAATAPANAAKPDASKAEAPKPDVPKAEAAKTEAPKAEAPKADAKSSAAATAAPVAAAPEASTTLAQSEKDGAAANKAGNEQSPAEAQAKPEQSAPLQAKTAAASPTPVSKPKPAPVPPPQPTLLEEMASNPFILPGAGLLLVGLGALGVFIARRRKKSKQFGDSIITDSSLKANSLFGSTGGQSVDTNNSVFNSNFAPSANQLDTNEVDPIAEADVYIAYGRDAQAEEILKEALRTQPDRNAVRVKLLEIYSARKDLRAFEVVATELYGLTRGEGNDWTQAALLGASLDPNNPLYAGGRKPADKPEAAVSRAAPAPAPAAQLQKPVQPPAPVQKQEVDFDMSSLTAEAPARVEPVLKSPAAAPEPKTQPAAKAPVADLDFNLGDMDLGTLEVPNTIPRPAPTELHADLSSIDFDFLDEPKSSAAKPEEKSLADKPVAKAAAPAAMAIDLSAYDLTPMGGDATAAAEAPAPAANFDLSSISLELNANDAPQEEISLDMQPAASSDDASPDSEMATKLDLAVAYREIGDKEGAKELLDEVLKGGSAAQSEKARSLLLELA